jgi:SAM-dependent methyltransferase
MDLHSSFDEDYYRWNNQSGDRPALWLYARLVRRYLGGGPILDIGCGTGNLLRRLSYLGAADGLEVSHYAAERARAISPKSNVVTDLGELASGYYGRVTIIHVVEHIPDDQLRELFRELRRITRPDARFLVVTPDLAGQAHRLKRERWDGFADPTHINLKSHSQWRNFLGVAGLAVEREANDGLWNVPYSRLPLPLDALRYSIPMAIQFLMARLIVRPGKGESCILVLRWADSD